MLRKERISSRFSEVMKVHRGCRASTMSSHSFLAAIESEDGRRWLNNVLIAVVSGELAFSGMRRTSRPERGCQEKHVLSRRWGSWTRSIWMRMLSEILLSQLRPMRVRHTCVCDEINP